MTEAANSVGVTRQCILDNCKKDPVFRQRKEEVENKVLDIVENALYAQCEKGNITAIIFALCNRRVDDWRNLRESKNTIQFSKEINEALDKIAKMIK
jgi:hypothetical protein